jgi:hypothetical protein
MARVHMLVSITSRLVLPTLHRWPHDLIQDGLLYFCKLATRTPCKSHWKWDSDTNDCKLKSKFNLTHCFLLLDVTPQYSLHPIKGFEARSNIHLITPILVIQALDGGISSTDTRSLTTPTSLTHTRPSNMTVVLDDPSWWPIIHSQLFYSYWIGSSCQPVMYWCLDLISTCIFQSPPAS